MREARRKSLCSLPTVDSKHVLVSGVGTGLDLPWLPQLHSYTALDFNSSMLSRAKSRNINLEVDFVLGDSMALPFANKQFDHVILHLIVAVVPNPELCLREASRVLKPGGSIILFDKFLNPNQHAPMRRLFNGITRRFATRMDVIFEELLHSSPELEVVCDAPMLVNGWFRGIVLLKPNQVE